MLADIGLLTSIFNYAKSGKLDSYSLGEIIDDAELKMIDPDMTSITRIIFQSDKKQIRILFDIIKELTPFERIIWSDVFMTTIGILSVVTMVTLGKLYVYSKKIKRQSNVSERERTEIIMNTLQRNLARTRAEYESSGAVRNATAHSSAPSESFLNLALEEDSARGV